MIVTVSSGNSVDEVCRALWHFLAWLKKKEYVFEVVKLEYAKCDDGYKSIMLESEDENLLTLEGSHLWKAQSPFRPKHKRKNWYFTLSCQSAAEAVKIDESKVIYQTMKSPKKGGQHVNTTCSGVRAVYASLGVEAVSYDERSQYRNKSIALKRLKEKINMIAIEKESKAKNERWKNGKILERGNAMMVFEGDAFMEI